MSEENTDQNAVDTLMYERQLLWPTTRKTAKLLSQQTHDGNESPFCSQSTASFYFRLFSQVKAMRTANSPFLAGLGDTSKVVAPSYGAAAPAVRSKDGAELFPVLDGIRVIMVRIIYSPYIHTHTHGLYWLNDGSRIM